MQQNFAEYLPLNLYSNLKQAAEKHPQQRIIFDITNPAMPELGNTTDYTTMHNVVLQRAKQLASAGIKSQDKVMLFKSPLFDTYLLAMAVSYLGAVPVMVSYHLSSETIQVFCERLADPFIIFDDVTEDRIQQVSNSSKHKQISVSKLLTYPMTEVAQTINDLDEIAYITHTSGTTGIPKLICHSQRSMGYRKQWHQTVFHVINPDDLVAFHISPVHSRFNIGVSSIMGQGAPMLVLSSFNLNIIRDMLHQYQPKALETHPNNFVQWIPIAEQHPESFANVKYYHSTFDAINLGTMKIFLNTSAHNNPVFLQVYGQSECGPMIYKLHNLDNISQHDSRDMGVPLEPLSYVRICDQQAKPVANNITGNIQFLSRGRALTYYKEDARFNANTYGENNEWWDSGDFGKISDNGHLYLLDRQVDLIEGIESSLALEDILLDQLPFIEEIVIIRGKDNRAQPIIAVYENQIMDWEKWHIAIKDLPYLNPPIIKKFDEIPHTATMKVQRLQIEELLKKDLF